MFSYFSKKYNTSISNIMKIYNQQLSLNQSQSHYMKNFLYKTNTKNNFLKNFDLQLYYTCKFSEISENICNIAEKNNFYKDDIIRLFKEDKQYTQLILENYNCLYLKYNNKIIGFLLFSIDNFESIIQFLFIDHNYRQKSLGSFLVLFQKKVIKYLKNLGLIKINKKFILSAYTKNPAMINLLLKTNFMQLPHNNPHLTDHKYYILKFKV